MATHDVLANLTPFKYSLPIRVKVLALVDRSVVSKLEKYQILFGDEKGTIIEATLLKEFESSSEITLREDQFYEIKNFIVNVKSERVRLSKHPYHILLNSSSIILRIDKFTDMNFYRFQNFEDVYRGLAHPKFSIDLYGAIVGVGFLEEFMADAIHQNNGFIDYKIKFFILNIDTNVVIKCVAYGALAQVLEEFFNSTNADFVFCVLQFWQVNWGVGKGRLKSVSSIEGFSKIIFEPTNVPQIDVMRKRIANEE